MPDEAASQCLQELEAAGLIDGCQVDGSRACLLFDSPYAIYAEAMEAAGNETTTPKTRSLSQSLAVQTQIHLPGTVGRLLKQIRDLERSARCLWRPGLVRAVDRPAPLTVDVAGISTKAVARRVAGGFLYAAAGVANRHQREGKRGRDASRG